MDTHNSALVEKFRQQALEYAARAGLLNNDNQNILTEQPNINNTETDYETFLNTHPGKGRLKIQVSTARGSFPVEGGSVEVSRIFGGEKRVFFKEITDQSGIVDNLELPALPSAYSQNSSTAEDSSTDYNVAVYHPDFVNEPSLKIGIYDGIETLLPVSLQPLIR